ncbi:hypothetical protein QM012_005591 [Aureobasidium pullulans]|uniref:Major facilitator superfamily (MFS) profile domain-containing protein n=1 Tax=Aureobasidium pullulans TaxID=5580 RepID=A0ABR0T5U0_AURPU
MSVQSPLRGTQQHQETAVDLENQHAQRVPKTISQSPDGSPEPNQPNQYLVDWNGPDDPDNPQNWSKTKKWVITMMLSTLTFAATFASSVFSSATMATSERFRVNREVMVLGSSLFVLGFALGPILWGPLSELYGRKSPLFVGIFFCAIFQIPVALAQNIETILVCRFLGGIFGYSPMAVVGGALADIWDPIERGVAVGFFAGATFVGPLVGPVAGSFITQSSLGWRWTEWLTLIIVASFGSIAVVVVPETSPAILLSRKATFLRRNLKDASYHAAHDSRNLDLHDILLRYILRPLRMLFTEPILAFMTLFMSFVYGVFYLFFFSYPIAFSGQRGWSSGIASLPFLGIIVGIVLGCGYIVWFTRTKYAVKMASNGQVVPEERLPPMFVGSVLFPLGLFWFAWTSSSTIIWVPQVLAGIPIGAGVLIIFIQGFNYIIDVYLAYANSALAANALVRSLLGAAFPLFASAMYDALGVAWATSLLGFLEVAMVPVPVLFYCYGRKIRGWSRMTMNKT